MSGANLNFALGLDIGGTDTKAVVVDRDGNVHARSSEQTVLPGAGDRASIIARLQARVARLIEEFGAPIDLLGAALPGIASNDERSIAWLPEDKLPMANVDLKTALHWASHVPVLNDAHAALLGEAWHGAAADRRHVVMLTLGTGVGGAILMNGSLVRGSTGRAGHLGHIGIGDDSNLSIVGMPGSLEEAVGDVSVQRRSSGRFTTTRALVDAARGGDGHAQHTWDRSTRALAYALASLINILDPELIVISGGIAGAGDDLFVPLRRHLAAIEWKPNGTNVPVVPAIHGPWAGAIGAASRTFNNCL